MNACLSSPPAASCRVARLSVSFLSVSMQEFYGIARRNSTAVWLVGPCRAPLPSRVFFPPFRRLSLLWSPSKSLSSEKSLNGSSSVRIVGIPSELLLPHSRVHRLNRIPPVVSLSLSLRIHLLNRNVTHRIGRPPNQRTSGPSERPTAEAKHRHRSS